jgi:hypothetical protein
MEASIGAAHKSAEIISLFIRKEIRSLPLSGSPLYVPRFIIDNRFGSSRQSGHPPKSYAQAVAIAPRSTWPLAMKGEGSRKAKIFRKEPTPQCSTK